MKTIAAVLLACVVFVTCSWASSHASVVWDCSLWTIVQLPSRPMYRVYVCENGVLLYVPAGRFPRVPGPSDKTPL